jgi:CheY-like chemotaxis protein
MLHLLIVEDQEADAELTIRSLRGAGLQFRWERVDTPEGFREALTRAPDVVISDGQVPGFGGMAALAIVKAETPDTPFILLSGAPWDHGAQEALQAGVAEYVCKADLRALAPAVRRAIAGLHRRF